ncbi:hypothetical protein [Desertimonas flava]|uniref:hypothetical protein n=1 Tax=Desertimonas flava TaxID=2064846 RepID=UPI000E35737B|nr:hypothetical protein [Desertimonas flava]
MMTDTHPNAVWLAEAYRGGAAIAVDPALDADERARRQKEHQQSIISRMSPDMVIHTGGVRLAVTAGMDFLGKYHKRRAMLADANVQPVEIDQILADDHYGIVHGTFRTTRGHEVWTRVGLGAWRFENQVAVEHWELANGPRWDEWFLSGDPEFNGSALEFWTRGV